MSIAMILDKPYPPDPRITNQALMLTKVGYKIDLFCLDFNRSRKKIENKNGMKIHFFSCSLLLYKKFRALAYTFPWAQPGRIDDYLKETECATKQEGI